ncbi:MAG: M23 family metallopeptidase [Firmicutes bacterium]|jgi:murein DD-endopeptidase MepM/ murein hydrolase activator NlpD|nr:M23 family metallopeptidase [Bacillota bacterium]
MAAITIKTRSAKPKKTALFLTEIALFALLIAVSLSYAYIPSRASASINTDRSTEQQLENRIAQDGNLIQNLVTKLTMYQEKDYTLSHNEKSLQKTLLLDRKSQIQAAKRLRQVAIESYVGIDAQQSNSGSILSVSNTNASVASVYAGVASDTLNSAISQLQIARARTRTASTELTKTQKALNKTILALQAKKAAADAAIAADDSMLHQVKGNIQLILAQEAQRHLAEQRQAELILAHRAEATAAANPVPPPVPRHAVASTVISSTGTYANPLRSVAALTPDRIDQGVDYSGYGPIYAIGDAVILSTYNGGWPGGAYICYRLTAGPAAGLVVYAAEDINPTVQVGQSVNANTVIGDAYEGPDGIETGWAAPAADGLTMAAANGQFYGSNSTAFGANFSQLLQSLGAPGGVPQNPPTGAVPPGWPVF